MLWRKLWRDMRDNWGAYLACVSVIVIGLMLFVALSQTLENLSSSQTKYYQQYKFADGFAKIVTGPKNLQEEISKIPGIDRVEGRIVQDVLMYRPQGEETTLIRLVSFNSPQQDVNRFKLESGSVPRPGEREILVSPAFLKGNNLHIGQQLPLIIAGHELNFNITGTANSPEYIYEIPNGQTMAPNPKNFGVAYLPYDTIAKILAMDSQINDLVFSLDQGVDFLNIKLAVAQRLQNYGLTQLLPRKDQLSNNIFDQKLTGLKSTATTTPAIFLLVAAGILYIMLKRMVEHQRGQIGVLKAFGFSDLEILGHYLSYAVIIGFLGGMAGGLCGAWLTYPLATLYQQYFNVPGISGGISFYYIMMGTIAAICFSCLAGFQGAKQVLALTPAEAMHAAAPQVGKKILVEHIGFFWRVLNTQGKMALRNLFRNKRRTIMTVLGVAFAFSMMVSSGASYDAVTYLVNFQFDTVEKYDLKVYLRHTSDMTASINAAKNIAGVTQAEPMLEMPVTFNHHWLNKDLLLTGLPKNAKLYRLVNDQGVAVSLPDQGVLVSNQLAKVLSLKVGDQLMFTPMLGEKKNYYLTVSKIVPQYVGMGAYMEIGALSKLLQSAPAATSLILATEKTKLNAVRKELQKGQEVASFDDKTKMKAQFEELMASSSSTQYILLLFAFLTGFAIVYNVTLISLAERERELATLLVIGMTEREVSSILVFELLVLGMGGILLGIPLSYFLLYAMTSASSSDMYNLPLIISQKSFLLGLAGTALFIAVALWKTATKVSNLSMLDVLKQQD